MNQASDLRIGELLIKSGMLSAEELSEAMQTAESTGLPVGRVMIMAGYLSESDFQSAVQAQSLVRDQVISLDVGVNALKLVNQQGIEFAVALKESGFEQQEDPQHGNKLGDLLREAGIVPEAKIEATMATSQSTGLPLGRLLISLALISEEMLATALNAQTFIRAETISREDAIAGLKVAYERRRALESDLKEQGYFRAPRKNIIRLGELLRKSDLLTSADVDEVCLEVLTARKPAGEILVDRGLLSPALLDHSLQVQEMLANETISIEQAANTLKWLHTTGCDDLQQGLSLFDLSREEIKSPVRYIDVLKVAGLIAPSESRTDNGDSAPSADDAHTTAATLLEDEMLDERLYFGSLRCYYLIATGWLSMQQGIIALNYFHHKTCSFDEVLHELKWTIRTFRRSADEQQRSAAPTAT